MKLRHADIFCGIGGFSEALKEIAEPVLACDIDKTAAKLYVANYEPERFFSNIFDIDECEAKRVQIDILTAGIPCQPYSRMGKKKGLQDERANVLEPLLNIVRWSKPRLIIFECVPQFRRHFETTELYAYCDSNYPTTAFYTLKGSDFGNPTMRTRMFYVCSDKETIKDNIESYHSTSSLSSLFNRAFEKKYAYTFRTGGQGSGITSRHNWEIYIRDNEVYSLTARDCLDVMGYGNYDMLNVSERKMKSLIGNSICVNIARALAYCYM